MRNDEQQHAMSKSKKGRPSLQLKKGEITPLFNMPQPTAAKLLGVSLTSLKRECRKFGILKWPFRRRSQPADDSAGESGRDMPSTRASDHAAIHADGSDTDTASTTGDRATTNSTLQVALSVERGKVRIKELGNHFVCMVVVGRLMAPTESSVLYLILIPNAHPLTKNGSTNCL